MFSPQGVFSSMDKNRNGVLSMAELENVFNLMGITNNKTIKAIIAQWDEAGNGNVSFQDFVK
jgi:Ca2+-binding EF-hand superfamily protein